jgi:prepilin-type N-terminal cleavage/methylation domain-containing protein
MKFRNTQNKGFTLIEVLLVVVIIGIAAALSFQSVADARRKVRVDGVCESLAGMTNKARAYALAGVSGADKTQMICDDATDTCRVQSHSASSGAWSDIDSAYVAQGGVQIFKFSSEYAIPYAAVGSGATGNINEGSFSKTLTITNFKATCQ